MYLERQGSSKVSIIDQIRTLIPTIPGWCEPEKASELCDLVLKTNPRNRYSK